MRFRTRSARSCGRTTWWTTRRRVPPGLQPKIDLLLGWGKWACLILGVAGILICAGKMALGQSGRSHYAAEGASELPKVLLGVSLATVAVPIITAIFG
ncbi:hypothetical protein N5079_15715 [Planotetraspora sp. A-T 1434]|uniref:hypothetical protein n=1 Tax=Planotetraspora sp. A-T 1434 TaxID=2979219 RepID=UPI0021BE9D22|nr:hypothetical protein [Planotetraspora sp. A-T 1434]MCT9931661.1 hypothetical protein [Planotetraspora sp. A-T 1434]